MESDGVSGRPVVGRNGLQALRFQYFPDEITDSKTVTYAEKTPFGASLPIYQWTASGARTVSFNTTFSSDLDLVEAKKLLIDAGISVRQSLLSTGIDDRNVDVRAALAWLRQYQLPTYSASGGAHTKAPKRLRLYIPNSGLGVLGGLISPGDSKDSVLCFVSQCEITFQAFFPSGLPRLAQVQLTFTQLAQHEGSVRFPSAGPMAPFISGDGGGNGYQLRGTVAQGA